MSNRFDDGRFIGLDVTICNEITRHFAGHLVDLSILHQSVNRLEENISKYSLAASMAAARVAPKESFVPADDGEKWHKSVELADNCFLCHRPLVAGAEFAVLEHFPARNAYEIRCRGWNAIEVLRIFIEDQQQSLEALSGELTAGVGEFLAERHPGRDWSQAAESFISRLLQPLPPFSGDSGAQDQRGGTRI